jgi:hypothetical protein
MRVVATHKGNNSIEPALNVERVSGGPGSGNTPKDGPQHEPRTAGIIVVKNATRNLAGRIEARNRRAIAMQHF